MVGGAINGIKRLAQQMCQGDGIDVGAGLWPLEGAKAVDIWRGAGKVRHIDSIPPESQDFVFSSHCLEHIERWEEALDNWIGKLKPGGLLFLYLPHPECAIWNPGSPFVGDGHKWQPEPEQMDRHLTCKGMAIVSQDAGPDVMMSFYIMATKPH